MSESVFLVCIRGVWGLSWTEEKTVEAKRARTAEAKSSASTAPSAPAVASNALVRPVKQVKPVKLVAAVGRTQMLAARDPRALPRGR